MPTQSSILLFDFFGPAGPDAGPGAGGGETGSGDIGASGAGAGASGVCVGGCGLVCGSINLCFSLIYNPIVRYDKRNGYSLCPVQLLEWIT